MESFVLGSILNRVPLTYANVFLFLLLQLSLWSVGLYSVWQDDFSIIEAQKKAQKSLLFQERLQTGQYFPDHLKVLPWLSWEWKQERCDAVSINEVTNRESKTLDLCLTVSGNARSEQWQTALLQLDEFASFRPVAMHWVRLDSGNWQGSLSLRPLKDRSNRLAYSLFPFARFSGVMSQESVQLVGTVLLDDEFKSLLMIGDRTLSISQGDWLPDILASVVSLDAKKVGLRYLNGNEYDIFLNSRNPSLKGERE